MNIHSEFNRITKNVKESDVCEKVDELKEDYIDSDWADEFDDIHEAYEEQGRGQAEHDAINEVIVANLPGILPDPYCELYDLLADHWNLRTE